jgi:Xaa-Pro aminopeptidase
MEPIGFDKKRASEIMQSLGVDVLVASSPENVFYSSGLPVRHAESDPILYSISNQYPSIVVVGQDGEEALIAWQLFMSADKASWIKNVNGVFSRDEALQNLASLIEEAGLRQGGTIGIESVMPYYQSCWLERVFSKAKIRVSDDVFIEMRLEKSAEEIVRIRESTRIAEKAIQSLINSAKEGVSDIELVKVAKARIIQEGGAGFNIIDIGVGDSDWEYPVTGVTLKKGDVAKFDIGAVYGGYCSDVSRVTALGAPSKDVQGASNLMIDIEQACADAIKPGVEPLQAVEAAEDAYKKSKGEGFFFLTIHSLGILIDEYTFYGTMLGPSSKPFEKNMVINIESLTVVPPQGFIGIEDTYLVKDSGLEKVSILERRISKAPKRGK